MIRILVLILLFFPNIVFSQTQSNSSYSSLNLNSSSRALAMGGELIAVMDEDLSLANMNPSLLNSKMDKAIAFNFVDYVSDINFVSFHFSKRLKDNMFLFLGVDALNYGRFDNTDNIGNVVGEFSGGEQILTLSLAKYLGNNFTIGTNLKYLNSRLESYYSQSISSNFGLTYYNASSEFTSSLLFRNVGSPITYYTSIKESLPFEVQIGLSKLLKYLPFRYSLVFHHLTTYDISNSFFPNTIYDPELNKVVVKDETIAKKLLRHVIIGGEFNPFRKSFFLRGGFNFQRREDLKLYNGPSFIGFSWGFGFRIYKFHLNYSRSAYHTSSMLNNISIITNLSNFGL